MRVGIVNDLRLAVEALRRVVTSESRHRVAWIAHNGAEAVAHCRADVPDVILMDLVMPMMNGAEATGQIMKETPCPILVVTSTLSGNFALVCDALGKGAVDAIRTPVLADDSVAPGAELLAKLHLIERMNAQAKPCAPTANAPALDQVPTHERSANPESMLVALGASTGGPHALAVILKKFPATFPAAVVIAQHIDSEFSTSLVGWWQEQCALPIRVAVAGEQPEPGVVVVASSRDHLVLTAQRRLMYSNRPSDCPFRPSVDALFGSLAEHWPTPGVGVLLTGIGRDGAQGLLALHQRGWFTIAQDEESSVVYGMPRAARELGAASRVLPLEAISSRILAHFKRTQLS